ncbi:hypothetical protein BGW80DRAFT_1513676 [Lactifluus volemus]|nr:hypothetical protein BGW80DRAFT_1513676 [Lactifluus volemus]
MSLAIAVLSLQVEDVSYRGTWSRSVEVGTLLGVSAVRDERKDNCETCAAHTVPIEMYAFSLNWSARSVEKSQKGRSGKATQSRVASKKCYSYADRQGSEVEDVQVLEWKRSLLAWSLCLAVKHHGHGPAAQTSIMKPLQYYEHLSEPMAECLNVLLKEFDHAQLGEEILREIAAKSFNPKTDWLAALALGLKSFLIRELTCSEDLTSDAHQTQKQLNGLYDLLLECTLDFSSYVRSKVFTILSRLCDLPVKFPKQRLAITRIAVSALEDKVAGVRRNAIWLIVKLMVTHPYGLMHSGLLGMEEWEDRYREVMKELQKTEKVLDDTLSGNTGEADGDEATESSTARPVKKRSRRRNKNAEDAMDVDEEGDDSDEVDSIMDEDESESSRAEEGGDDGSGRQVDGESTQQTSKKSGSKSELAMAALTDEQAALAALESNQLLHLRLRKRYYAEALNFIRQVEEAAQMIFQLLGSTHKAEVLEAMEFFRVAHEYQLDSVEIGIKKMLHLIWQKDNSSMSEDGKELKGVRSRLLECYRSLYFDPLPDMEPKRQVNRIAKNMVECVGTEEHLSGESLVRFITTRQGPEDWQISNTWNPPRNFGPSFSKRVRSKTLAESWKGEMDGILFFIGLFSATVAAFIIYGYQSLSRNSDTTNLLLTQISQQLSASAAGSEPIPPPFFLPPFNVASVMLHVNILSSLNLVLSVDRAVAATQRTCRQLNSHHLLNARRAYARSFFKRKYKIIQPNWTVRLTNLTEYVDKCKERLLGGSHRGFILLARREKILRVIFCKLLTYESRTLHGKAPYPPPGSFK